LTVKAFKVKIKISGEGDDGGKERKKKIKKASNKSKQSERELHIIHSALRSDDSETLRSILKWLRSKEKGPNHV